MLFAAKREGDSLSTTKSRLLAGASAAAIAGSVLAVSPIAVTAASAAPTTSHIRVKDVAQAEKVRERIVETAKRQVGDRYILGSTGPGAFDCSGLVQFSYRKVTGKTLPRTSYQLARSVKRIKASNRRVGDLVFFNGNGHVAIYAGKGRIVHASNPRRGVRMDSLSGWYRSTLGGYGRVVSSHGR